MEDIQLQNNETQNFAEVKSEPDNTDNSETIQQKTVNTDSNITDKNGEFSKKNPENSLILGKFKNVEDLSKAYEELQKHQGQCSDELGALRREIAAVSQFKQSIDKMNTLQNSILPAIAADKEKYNTPEYFQDPSFREIYKEAVFALGENLDSERLINLLESYVSARIYAHDKKTAADKETQKVLDSVHHSENSSSSFKRPKKSLDEMTEAEVDEMLDRLI